MSEAKAGPSKSRLLNQIAMQLNDAEDILAAVQSQQLKARPDLKEAFVAPATPTEKTLAEIWTQVLNVSRIGINDNFFNLGGTSLMATQLLSYIYDAFQVELTLKELFDNAPTISGLAESIEQHQIEQASMSEIVATFEELNELSDDDARELLSSD
jgi:acyl carrier protein